MTACWKSKITVLLVSAAVLLLIQSGAAISNEDTAVRLTKLETTIAELHKAIALARVVTEQSTDKASSALNIRLEGMNEFRAQMNKAEATYATKDAVATRIREIERLVYMGVGGVFVLQLFVGIYLSRKGKERTP